MADATKLPTYGRLNQTHGQYDPGLCERLRLLYVGGYEIIKSAKVFLPKHHREPQNDYDFRLKYSAYENHLAPLIGFISGALFNLPLEITPAAKIGGEKSWPDAKFYPDFLLDVDREGTPFYQFMRVATNDALLYRRALVGIDMPPKVEGAENRLQEDEAGGARAYLFRVDLSELINWEKQDKPIPGLKSLRAFQWCVLKRKVVDRSSPFADASRYRYRFRVWQLIDGVAFFSEYQTKLIRDDAEIQKEEELEQFKPPTPTSFRVIPILDLEMPQELWAGNRAGPLCEEHYRLRSDLNGAVARTNIPVPFIQLGPEIGGVNAALPSMVQQDPDRGSDPQGEAREKGVLRLGAGDKFGFAEPAGGAFEISMKLLAGLMESIFRSMHAMALSFSNTPAALGRSGESKKEDRSATGVMLDYIGDTVRGFARLVFQVVSEGRQDQVDVSVSGLDTFDDEDVDQVVELASQVAMLVIPSATFQRVWLTQVALSLLRKQPSDVKAKIKAELEKNVTDEMVLMPPSKNPDDDGDGGDDQTGGAKTSERQQTQKAAQPHNERTPP